MLDVTEQLRRFGEAVEEQVLDATPPPRRPGYRRPRVAALAAAAAVLAVTVTGAVVLTRDDDHATDVRVADSPPPPMVDSAAAQELCDTKGREAAGADAVLRAAFESSRAEVMAWQLTRIPGGPNASDFVTRQPPVSRMVVCYFDGLFPVPTPAGSPPTDRAVVLATADRAQLHHAGPKAGLEIARPPIATQPSLSPTAAQFIGVIRRVGLSPRTHSFDGATLPPGVDDLGGSVVGDYMVQPVYAVDHFLLAPGKQLHLFSRSIAEQQLGQVWRVVDALEIEHKKGEYMSTLACTLDGEADNEIVAIPPAGVDERFVQPRVAWRFDRSRERVVPIDPARVLCEVYLG